MRQARGDFNRQRPPYYRRSRVQQENARFIILRSSVFSRGRPGEGLGQETEPWEASVRLAVSRGSTIYERPPAADIRKY